MSESDPIDLHGHKRTKGDNARFGGHHGGRHDKGGTTPLSAPTKAPLIAFSRFELSQILSIYGRRVAEGEWRDYAIDMLKDRAVFSIFRRASEFPLYRIEKTPALARRQGAFSVITPTGQILKRGHDLKMVLRVLDKKPKLVEV